MADNPVSGVDVETAGDWAKKEFMENDLGSFVSVTRDGSNVDYIIDIDGQAAALVGGDGTDEDKKKAEDFLARNIGIKTSTDVSGELNLTYAITTEDRDNPEVDGSPSSTEKSVQLSLNVSGRADIFTIDAFCEMD